MIPIHWTIFFAITLNFQSTISGLPLSNAFKRNYMSELMSTPEFNHQDLIYIMSKNTNAVIGGNLKIQ